MKRRVGYSWISFVLFASTVWAQEPLQSLADVPSRVQTGDRVRVILRDGMIFGGTFDSVSGSTLHLSRRDIPGSMVKEIQKKRPEPAWNGVLIGLAVGVGAGVVASVGTCGTNDAECSAIATAVFLPTFAGGGAAVGAVIDRLTSKYDSIYVQQADAGHQRLRLAPLIARSTKGVQLSWSF